MVDVVHGSRRESVPLSNCPHGFSLQDAFDYPRDQARQGAVERHHATHPTIGGSQSSSAMRLQVGIRQAQAGVQTVPTHPTAQP